jgi:predicted Rossmann-fold nucleotide-binding protein
MGKNIENFRDELVKFANIVEIVETTFINDEPSELITYVDEPLFNKISKYLTLNFPFSYICFLII